MGKGQEVEAWRVVSRDCGTHLGQQTWAHAVQVSGGATEVPGDRKGTGKEAKIA